MPLREPDTSWPEAMAAFRAGKRPAGLVDGVGLEESGISVTHELTAASVGSGDLPVLASPAIVALVERAAVRALGWRLPPELTTVGASFVLTHSAPTPAGDEISMDVRLEPGDSRKLRFEFAVHDGAGEVARGSHVRVIVEREPFMRAADGRRVKG
jgi:predicted thioesterase